MTKVFWFTAFFSLSQIAFTSASSLQPGKPVVQELSGGGEHSYHLKLAEGEFAKIDIEQQGIDVVVKVPELKGHVTLEFDDEYRAVGKEIVEIVAEGAGIHSIIVRASSKSAPNGTYEIRVVEIRPATEKDRSLFETLKLEEKARHSFRAGRYEEGRKFAEQSITIAESDLGTDNVYAAKLLFLLAEYYQEKQDFAKSIALHERALAIAEKNLGTEHPLVLLILRSLATDYDEINEPARALGLADRCLEGSKILGPEHHLVARCLQSQAYATNDTKKVDELLQQALVIAEKTLGSEDLFVAVLLNQLGVNYLDQHDYQKAESVLIRSQAIKEKTVGSGNIAQSAALLNLGMIAREKKDYAKAEENYNKAIEIVENAFGPENPRLAFILNNIANIYRAKGDFTKSLETHLRVLRIAETHRGPYHPLTGVSLGNIAKTYAAIGDVEKAIEFQSRVDTVIERNIELNIAIGSERQKLSYLDQMAERADRTISLNVDLAPNDPGAGALAALIVLQRKGRVLDAMSESFGSLRQRATGEQQILIKQFNETTAQLANLVLNGTKTMTFEQHQKKIHELEGQKEQLETEISKQSAEFRARSIPVTLAAIQSAIPDNSTLIEFVIYRPFDPKAESNKEAYKEPRYIALILHQKGEVLWRDLGEVKVMHLAIDSFRQALRDPERNDVKKVSKQLAEKIMQPIQPYLKDSTLLIVSPDGALNLIPFEALVDEQNRYLIEDFSFIYLTSGRDLLRLQVERESKTAPLVLANPKFGNPQSAKNDPQNSQAKRSITTASDMSEVYFAPLVGTTREAKDIKSLFKDATVLTGEQATEASIKQVSAPSILHVATHGFFVGNASTSAKADSKIENPLLRSGLALADANLKKSEGEDGIVTALEASGLNLWGTKLVTLSACDTGLGEIKNGEGVYGLRRAFLLAGTETLLMSLWPVSDSVTHELMNSYYKGLKQGRGRSEALRNMQIDMLKRKDREHPFYWASFIQAGEWANLDGKR